MSLLTARGQKAFESATQKKIDLKKVYIRLKDGESVRVRLLGINERTVGEYKAHGDYKKGIFTTPCIEPTGEECPYCVASNSGVEGWDKFYSKKRYLIVFFDIDAQALRVWDASKQQGETVLKLMEEYADSINDMAFTFKRVGSSGVDTTYNLIPILKLKPEDKEKFEAGANVEIPTDFFDQVLIPKTRKQMIENLMKAGFPVADFFDITELNTNTGTETGVKDDSDAESIDEDETKNF